MSDAKQVSDALLKGLKLSEKDFFEAYERGDFADPRFMEAAVAGLRHPNANFGKFLISDVLPHYGRTVVPLLLAGFNEKGRHSDASRLWLMHEIAPDLARPSVERALENGTPEVKWTALGCLTDSPGDNAILLAQSKARAAKVKERALSILSRRNAPEMVAELCHALDSPETTHRFWSVIGNNSQPEVLKHLLNQIRTQFTLALTSKSASPDELDIPVNWLDELLLILSKRPDRHCREVRDLLKEFDSKRSAILKIGSRTSPTFLQFSLSEALQTCSSSPKRKR